MFKLLNAILENAGEEFMNISTDIPCFVGCKVQDRTRLDEASYHYCEWFFDRMPHEHLIAFIATTNGNCVEFMSRTVLYIPVFEH